MKNINLSFKMRGCAKVDDIFSKSEINDFLNSIKINLINIGYDDKKNYQKKKLDWLIHNLYNN